MVKNYDENYGTDLFNLRLTLEYHLSLGIIRKFIAVAQIIAFCVDAMISPKL